MTTRSKILVPIAFSLLGAVLAGVGCNDADSASAVNVTLREFSVTPDQSTVPQGTVTFHVTNMGTVDHEFLVIRTNRAADALPTKADGSFEENAADVAVLQEVDDVPPGQSKDVSLNLSSGNYVLICNMVHVVNGITSAHYALGMRTAFRVN